MDNPKKDAIDSTFEGWGGVTQKTRRRPLLDWYTQIDKGHFHTAKYNRLTGQKVAGTELSDNVRIPYLTNSPRGSQVTTSDYHNDWGRARKRATLSDIGGPFFSQVSWIRADYPFTQVLEGVTDAGNGQDYHSYYRGPVLCTSPNDELLPTGTQTNLGPKGSTAIARCKPTNHIADLSTFLAELYADGLPKLFGSTLWQQRVNVARSSGGEYLNYEFGWAPLISDVSSILYSLQHARNVIQQYEHGSGSVTRRRYEFPIEQTLTRGNYSSDTQALATGFSNSFLTLSSKPNASLYKESRTWKRTWFSGAFTYHLPSGFHSQNALIKLGAKADALLSSSLDPDTLWNAGPWSWAVDWFSNAGDVISNLSDWATDGVVLKYGYIMEHSFMTDHIYARTPHNYQTRGAYLSPLSICVETKRRERATPFGFEVSWNGLSPRQLAISAALGLSRRWR